MTNRIVQMHQKVADAVSRLSVADNNWTFQFTGTEGKYYCLHSGYKEATLYVDVDVDGCVKFNIYDMGIVRFADGSQHFSFKMPAENLDEAQEDVYLDEHLIRRLNVLHGLV